MFLDVLILSTLVFILILPIIKLYIEKENEKEYIVNDSSKEKIENINLKHLEKETLHYKLNTDKVKYKLFSSSNLLSELSYLYKTIICDNIWINEPFHSKFYEILLTLNKNNFMIIDPHANVFTLNVRDENNKVQISKTYQVFKTNDVINFVIRNCIDDIIVRYNKKDAQNIILAIFLFTLKESTHYLNKYIVMKLIDELSKNYKYNEQVNYILDLIKENSENLSFILDSFEKAFLTLKTYPYNSLESIEKIQFIKKLPNKMLLPI